MHWGWHRYLWQVSLVPILLANGWGLFSGGTHSALKTITSAPFVQVSLISRFRDRNASAIAAVHPGVTGLLPTTDSWPLVTFPDSPATALTRERGLQEPDSLAAPSPLWLIVMPAIPILGGGFIYFKRRWFAKASTDAVCGEESPICEASEALADADSVSFPIELEEASPIDQDVSS